FAVLLGRSKKRHHSVRLRHVNVSPWYCTSRSFESHVPTVVYASPGGPAFSQSSVATGWRGCCHLYPRFGRSDPAFPIFSPKVKWCVCASRIAARLLSSLATLSCK